MSAKVKRMAERLEQIKARASELNAQRTSRPNTSTAEDLAEEAAGLGLELAEMLKGRK